MLRQVNGLTTQQWDAQYSDLRKDLKKFRSEVKEISDRNTATEAISTVDGYIGLPMLITILADIRDYTEKSLEGAFFQITNKTMKSVIGNKPIREMIANSINKDIREIVEELSYEPSLPKTPLVELNEERICTKFGSIAQQYYERGIKKHLNLKTSDEEAQTQGIFLPLILNELFCITAMELYKDLDDRQTANSWRIGLLMLPFLRKDFPAIALQNPFIIVREMTKMIHVDIANKILWDELAIWLEGMHLRCYYQIPEKYRQNNTVVMTEQGKMPTINEKDKRLQDNFGGVTMYHFARHHHETANQLFAKVVALEKLNEQHQAEEETKIDVKLTENPTILFQPAKPETKEQHLLNMDVLTKLMHQPVDMQLTMLVSLLETYQFSAMQNRIVETYVGVITATLEKYKGSLFSSNYFPTFFKKRPHAQLAEETIERLDRSNNPTNQIEILFSLWKDLKKGGSWKLINEVSDLIKTIITMLYKSAELDIQFSSGKPTIS